MKYFKSHLTLIFSLVALLSSYQFYLIVEELTLSYEKKLTKEYSIIAVASAKLEDTDFKSKSHLIGGVEPIDAEPFFAEFSDDFAPEVYEQLRSSLPSFYRVRLERYPSAAELLQVTDAVRSMEGIVKVESFAKSQNSISHLLSGLKAASALYLLVILTLNVLLFIKFMEVWSYEHSSRMQIMEIFGAPTWMRSATLVKMAIVSSVIATAITTSMFYYVSILPESSGYIKSIGLEGKIYFDPFWSGVKLGLAALAVSLFSASMVAFKRRVR